MNETLQEIVHPANFNYLINGGFELGQRGSSFSSPADGVYTLDRWRVRRDGTPNTFAITRQAFTLGQTSVPGEPKYFFRWDHTVAGTSQTKQEIHQVIEDGRPFANKYISLSFWAKSSSASQIIIELEQNFGSGGSPSSPVLVNSTAIQLTTSWTRYKISVLVPSLSGKTLGTGWEPGFVVRVKMPINSVFQVDLANMMFTLGRNNFAPFLRSGITFEEEVRKAQRFYEKSYDLEVALATATTNGITYGTGIGGYQTGAIAYMTVEKRSVPSLTSYAYGTGTQGVIEGNVDGAPASALGAASKKSFIFSRSSGTWTVTQTIGYHWTADAELYIT